MHSFEQTRRAITVSTSTSTRTETCNCCYYAIMIYRTYRLGDVVVATGIESFYHILFSGLRRDHNDRELIASE